MRFITPAGANAIPSRERRRAAGRAALSLCDKADALAAEAIQVIGLDDDRLFALLETREQMLLDLSEQVAVLQLTPATADNPLLAATERAVDEADAMIDTVCEALALSERATQRLAARVAQRVETLRGELAQVSRASTAGAGYQLGGHARAVDTHR